MLTLEDEVDVMSVGEKPRVYIPLLTRHKERLISAENAFLAQIYYVTEGY